VTGLRRRSVITIKSSAKPKPSENKREEHTNLWLLVALGATQART
jgi:hypothetical protein